MVPEPYYGPYRELRWSDDLELHGASRERSRQDPVSDRPSREVRADQGNGAPTLESLENTFRPTANERSFKGRLNILVPMERGEFLVYQETCPIFLGLTVRPGDRLKVYRDSNPFTWISKSLKTTHDHGLPLSYP